MNSDAPERLAVPAPQVALILKPQYNWNNIAKCDKHP
jgi:hypothetical protein